jgi:hypothetical protein
MASSSRPRNGDGRLKRVCLAGSRSIETFFAISAGVSPDGRSHALRAESATLECPAARSDDCFSALPPSRVGRVFWRRWRSPAALRLPLAFTRYRGRGACRARPLFWALSIYRDLGDRLNQALTLAELGGVRSRIQDYPGAAEVLDEALGILRGLAGGLADSPVQVRKLA